ncbi:hypothetical protein BC962_2598 [Gillisia mitskevichiae]|uniref:Glycine dehydrogenase n=1 Tax=Gillisia mitskevichiae TaxID=270921 RepID=A0A495P4M8_9FLAO|nr:hypothetical protein [Gillisia mitskevichiae]RKS44926.1 hypothetical protein BC962_2598 [Gillisia mitskevichiae]
MNNKKTFLVDCSEAAKCCDKSQYKESSIAEKVKMLLHLVFCKNCRKYSSNNTRLTKLIEKSNIQTCTEEQKKAWREKIKKEFTDI